MMKTGRGEEDKGRNTRPVRRFTSPDHTQLRRIAPNHADQRTGCLPDSGTIPSTPTAHPARQNRILIYSQLKCIQVN